MTVIVAGCGVFGLSTALELARSGHEVIALDKFPVPSPRSAANDLNKIIRTEYSDIFYSKLSLEALKEWETNPLYRKNYSGCGRITVSPNSKENQHRSKFELKGLENLKSLGADVSGIIELNSGKELGTQFPALNNNRLGDNIVAKFNPHAGFGHASKSLISVYDECLRRGVQFRFGPEGEVIGTTGRNSIKVRNGDTLTADKIILALGAATGLVLDLQNQIKALGLFVTHIQLTTEEYEKYKDIPIIFSAELGYFFPPDPDNHHLKVALTFGDVHNTVDDPFGGVKSVELPRYKDEYPGDTFPSTKGEQHVRRLLGLTLPDLSDHKLFNSKICWISDTTTSDFLIDQVPGTENIYVATGDAGHGYKFLPNIGKYIVRRINNELDEDVVQRWRWKNNPEFPTIFIMRAQRDHLDVKNIRDWWIDSKL